MHYRAWCNPRVRTKKCDSSSNSNLTTFDHNCEMNKNRERYQANQGEGCSVEMAVDSSRLFSSVPELSSEAEMCLGLVLTGQN